MPYKAKKPCGYPGCPELIREGRYCPAHKTEMGRQYNATRDPDYNQRYGRQWRKTRALAPLRRVWEKCPLDIP